MKKKRSLEIEGLPSAPAPGIQYNIVKLKNKIKKKEIEGLETDSLQTIPAPTGHMKSSYTLHTPV